MNRDALIDAIGRIDDDMLEQVNERRAFRKKTVVWKRWIAAAACAVLVMSTLLTVEANSGVVSNLLAPVFNVAQTEIIDRVGVPIGVSASADGYTLTADAVIGDRYNVAVVYTLTREDGQPIPENAYFREWKTDITSGSSGGGQMLPRADEKDPRRLHFVEQWSMSKPIIGRYVSASFSQLILYDSAEKEETLLAEGPWEISYTLRYQDSTIKVPTHKAKVQDADGKKYQIDKLRISPVGIHLEGFLLQTDQETEKLPHFHMFVKLADGSTYEIKDHTSGSSYNGWGKNADIRCEAMFEVPIPLEEMQSVIIENTEFPVKAK